MPLRVDDILVLVRGELVATLAECDGLFELRKQLYRLYLGL